MSEMPRYYMDRVTKAPISDLSYADLLKYKDISGFDTSRFPPYQDLEFSDRERLVLHMINSHIRENATFHAKKAKSKKPTQLKQPKQPKSSTRNVTPKKTLAVSLANLSTDELIQLARTIKERLK